MSAFSQLSDLVRRPCSSRTGGVQPEHRRAPKHLLTLSLVLGMVGCEVPAGPDTTRPSPDGISLQKAYEIDGRYFGGVVRQGSFAVSSEGAVAILDRFDPAVVLYRMASADTIRLGQRGEGPGEFAGPRSVLFLDPERVSVYDRALGRLAFWSVDGIHIADRSVPNRVMSLGHGMEDRILVKETLLGEGAGVLSGAFLVSEVPVDLADPIREVLRLYPPREEEAEEGELWRTCTSCPFFQAEDGGFVFRPHTVKDVVARTDAVGNLLHIWTAGRTPETFSQEEWVRHRRRGQDGLHDAMLDLVPASFVPDPPEFDESSLPPPGIRSVLDNTRGPLGVDGEGRLWTLPAVDRDQAGELDVFAPDGEYLGSLPLDVGPVQMSVRGEWIVVAYEDDLDEAVLRVYRIVDG